MPSLDGYSLSEEIKKLRKEVFDELALSRDAFSELYKYMLKFENQLTVKPTKNKTQKKKVKEEQDA